MRGTKLVGCVLVSVMLGACNSKPPPVATTPDPTVTGAPDPTPAPTPTPAPADAAPAPTESASPQAEEKTLFVSEKQVDCEGEGPMKCLQVRDAPDKDWTLLYTRIRGFDYEPGFRYELRVQVHQGAGAPADGSSLRYTLMKVVKKEKH